MLNAILYYQSSSMFEGTKTYMKLGHNMLVKNSSVRWLQQLHVT
jgi:hypothetical protein